MENEIQEILTELKNNDFERDCNDGSAFKEINLSTLETLLDYITNLQEELKSANESITWWQNRFNALQKENKKLKECYCDRTDCSGRIKDSKKYESLQQRIDKAIEYVSSFWDESHIAIYDSEDDTYLEDDSAKSELLKILKGEENE